ncbi:phosphoenolpyruvate carboxykinase (ATP), partial [Francisella tularensis subsp. holarctica]|uniref:phosphoenolpyruvate carboxykinase (ATP) n=1 Tax=Francisella tularensis TaxID=263 RepID=UPI0023819C00
LLIENPYFDDSHIFIFGDIISSQSNTYVSFPRENFVNVINTDNPNTRIFLVKDAYGGLPGGANLSKGQARDYVLSGY